MFENIIYGSLGLCITLMAIVFVYTRIKDNNKKE